MYTRIYSSNAIVRKNTKCSSFERDCKDNEWYVIRNAPIDHY